MSNDLVKTYKTSNTNVTLVGVKEDKNNCIDESDSVASLTSADTDPLRYLRNTNTNTLPVSSVVSTAPADHQQAVESNVRVRIRTCCICLSQTYYATICAGLILVGCPMGAIGSQEGVDWAMYAGITMVIAAFLLALAAPDIRGFFSCFRPSFIIGKFRGSKANSDNSKNNNNNNNNNSKNSTKGDTHIVDQNSV